MATPAHALAQQQASFQVSAAVACGTASNAAANRSTAKKAGERHHSIARPTQETRQARGREGSVLGKVAAASRAAVGSVTSARCGAVPVGGGGGAVTSGRGGVAAASRAAGGALLGVVAAGFSFAEERSADLKKLVPIFFFVFSCEECVFGLL